ncbi:MAG: hypothetical protein A2Z72_00165 [Omnitrophica bacterium RBG_13_46_9]|nr:MAG: hypothetical protein A2Z72_00165 [Omnitrophica bacterium RBG_13_46_9]
MRTTALVLVCLFTINTAAWAQEPISYISVKDTLAAQSVFKPLTDEGIQDSTELVFELIAGARLLLAGKSVNAVNGILTETYRNSNGARRIIFLEVIPSAEGSVKARFRVIGREDITFEIAYRDTQKSPTPDKKGGDDVNVAAAGLPEIAPVRKLTYENVFQEHDIITLTRLTSLEQESVKNGMSEKVRKARTPHTQPEGDATRVSLVSLHSPQHPAFANPLGIELLAGQLRSTFKDDCKISLMDMYLEGSIDAIVRKIESERPHIVGLSCQLGSLVYADRVIDRIRSSPALKDNLPLIVLGNTMATFSSEALLERYQDVIVVVGEGELAMEGLVKHIRNRMPLQEVPRITYKKDGQIVPPKKEFLPLSHGRRASPVTDLIPQILERGGKIWLMSSLGCPGGCSFCSLRYLRDGKGWDGVDVDLLLEHVNKLYTLGVRELRFADDCFISGDLKRIQKFAQGIIDMKLDVNIEFSTRADSVINKQDTAKQADERRRTLKLLHKAGLREVYLGIESGSDSQLYRYNKLVSVDNNIKALEELNGLGIRVAAGFIMFDPLMTIEEIRKNIEFLEGTGLIFGAKGNFVTNPVNEYRAQEGSPYVKMLLKEGLLGEKDPDYLVYAYRYKYPEVGEIARLCQEYKNATFPVKYCLMNIVSALVMKKNITENTRLLESYLQRMKLFEWEFLKCLVSIYEKDGRDGAEEIKRLQEDFIQQRRAMLEEMLVGLERGGIIEESGLLAKTIEEIGILPRASMETEMQLLIAENRDEKMLLSRSKRYLDAKAPVTNGRVNIHIDLSVIPREGLSQREQDNELVQNMETLARMIAWQGMFGLNVRYIFEHDTDRTYRDRAAEILIERLVSIARLHGIDQQELLLRIGPAHIGSDVIEVRLKNFDNIDKAATLRDREYMVALKDNKEIAGVSIPNYTAATSIGLSMAALRVGKENAAKEEYERTRGRILRIMRSIYKRNNVIENEDDFTEDELELMVTGGSNTKLFYTLMYALPPVAKVSMEAINEYHERMQFLLQAV